MQVELYIYKVQREFVQESGRRYIAQALKFGTPNSKWTAAGSLVELHYELAKVLPAFGWAEIENALETRGGL
jgi:hypothetical protein